VGVIHLKINSLKHIRLGLAPGLVCLEHFPTCKLQPLRTHLVSGPQQDVYPLFDRSRAPSGKGLLCRLDSPLPRNLANDGFWMRRIPRDQGGVGGAGLVVNNQRVRASTLLLHGFKCRLELALVFRLCEIQQGFLLKSAMHQSRILSSHHAKCKADGKSALRWVKSSRPIVWIWCSISSEKAIGARLEYIFQYSAV